MCAAGGTRELRKFDLPTAGIGTATRRDVNVGNTLTVASSTLFTGEDCG